MKCRLENLTMYAMRRKCIILYDEKQTLLHRVVSLTPFTTIHDGNFRRHSSCYVTIHDGNFRRIHYGYIHALRPGSEEVKQQHILGNILLYKKCRFTDIPASASSVDLLFSVFLSKQYVFMTILFWCRCLISVLIILLKSTKC